MILFPSQLPQVEWREYSFLQNSHLPKSVSESRLTVNVCHQSQLEGCSDGAAPAPVQELGYGLEV